MSVLIALLGPGDREYTELFTVTSRYIDFGVSFYLITDCLPFPKEFFSLRLKFYSRSFDDLLPVRSPEFTDI
jgi:hypothetical protein